MLVCAKLHTLEMQNYCSLDDVPLPKEQLTPGRITTTISNHFLNREVHNLHMFLLQFICNNEASCIKKHPNANARQSQE